MNLVSIWRRGCSQWPGHIQRLSTQRVTNHRTLCQSIVNSQSTSDIPDHNQSISAVHEYMGQPSHYTHPHLLAPNQLMPGIDQSEFAERRERLMCFVLEQFKCCNPSINTNHIRLLIIVPGARLWYSAPDVPFPFRQNADFLYLTGFLEPNSALILDKQMDSCQVQTTLFVQAKDPHWELWNGPRPGPNGAQQMTGIDNVLTRDRLQAYIEHSWKDQSSKPYVMVDESQLPEVEQKFIVQSSRDLFKRWEHKTPTKSIHELRVIKSPAEQSLIKSTCLKGAKALRQVMARTRPGMCENELIGQFECASRHEGADQLAYPPVVAAAHRANIIHYMQADQIMNDGDLILMDAGLHYCGYVSDITRTWPVNGLFTRPQRALYQALAQVQESLIEMLREERPVSLNQLLTRQMELMAAHCFQLGIFGDKEINDMGRLNQLLHKFSPHHVSHYLGMDVHDTSTISRDRPLQSGMVITVEPGIYFNTNDLDVPAEYRGLGLRIEDDVLITDTDCIVLTEHCPRTIHDIETLCKQ